MRTQSRIIFRSFFRIRVRNRGNGHLIGYVGDVSEGGLRLLCDSSVEPGTVLQLRLSLRDTDRQLRQVDVNGVCQWSRENTQTGYFEAGLAVDGPAPQFDAFVQQMRAVRSVPAECKG